MQSVASASLPKVIIVGGGIQDVLEAERVQDAGPIRAELNASSNLLERVRLLVHIDIDATLE
jgi:hypothetical protein